MDYLASKLLGLLTSTGYLILLVLMVGAVLMWLPHWRRGRAFLTAAILALAAIVFLPVQPALTGLLENRFPQAPPLPEHIDGIIILGGMIRPTISRARGRPTVNDAAERLLEGAHLARQHPEAMVLFTGGSADPWNSEARESDFASQALLEMGVDPGHLLIEDKSRNTYENAVYSRALAPDHGQGTWILVTSAVHMPRSVGIFRQTGWTVIPWPVNYLTGGEPQWANEDVAIQRLYFLSRTIHELVGLVYYRARGWSDSLFPAPETSEKPH
jgi:uncharacterized SAM-binding protein YcdF (DUF218 family)